MFIEGLLKIKNKYTFLGANFFALNFKILNKLELKDVLKKYGVKTKKYDKNI